MENAALKTAYEKLLALPEDKQVKAAELLDAFVEQASRDWDHKDYQLSPEQIESVRERIDNPGAVIPHEEVFKRLRQRFNL